MNRRFAIISPCRDEAKYARRSIESILSQSALPARWIIVDDGSTDDTPEILSEYEEECDFLTVVRLTNRCERRVGPGVIEAFYAGYEKINAEMFPFVCKLDLDLELPPRYFEILMDRMEADPRLGTCSGKPYFRHTGSGRLISEKCGDEMSVGMTKFYRTKCFEAIGGFVPEVMWDGIDCHRCRMLGWKAESWDDPEIRFIHLRPMGSSQQSIWAGRVRHGAGQHFMGTSFLYMTMSAMYRMTRPPWVIGGLGMWWGFVKNMMLRKPRYADAEFRRFLRRFQWLALRKGKAAAIRQIDQEQEAAWNDQSKSSPEKQSITKEIHGP